jgi:hypothetical protein
MRDPRPAAKITAFIGCDFDDVCMKGFLCVRVI